MSKALMVPLDGSAFAEHALPAALDLARRLGATLHVVRVHQPPILPSPDAPVIVDAAWVESLRTEELAYLQDVADRFLAPTGIAFATKLVDGFPADALSAYARVQAIDVILMTTHGRGGMSRFWLGSVADALVRQSRTPVLLIRPHDVDPTDEPAPALRHILVPTDGSELSLGVVEPALALGAPGGARYTLLRVLPRLWAPSIGAGEEAVSEEERADALAALERVARPLRARGTAIESVVLVDPAPAQAILSFASASDCDAIALATRGRSGWARVALGSVADKVMRGSTLPVLLYRPPAPGSNRPGSAAATAAATL